MSVRLPSIYKHLQGQIESSSLVICLHALLCKSYILRVFLCMNFNDFLPSLVAFTYLLEKKNALQLIMILKVTIYEQMTPKWLENKEVALKRPGSPNGWLLNWTDIPPRRAI